MPRRAFNDLYAFTAVAEARTYLLGALAAADSLQLSRTGKGHRPVHHFHALWRR